MSRTDPFMANIAILYPLKTPENQRFSGVFRRYKMGKLAKMGWENWGSKGNFIKKFLFNLLIHFKEG